MGPDLDQNLSLKASLHDKVSPVLAKIRRGVKTTREAFSEMVSSGKKTGDEVGQATSEMETKVVQDLSKIQDGLKATSGAFDEFSGTAKEGSGKVGKAIQDAVYTKGAEDRLEDLDKDLGKLDKTFKGMATKQRGVSGKARSVAATSSDNINKKVIPAFQELHATLDDYPETLEEINRLEQDRMRNLEEGQGWLSRVSDRVSGAGEGLKAASDELKFGLRDMAGLVAGGTLGVTGSRVQEFQTGAAQVAGVGAFEDTPGMLRDATMQARTTMEVIEPFAMSMMELQSVSVEVMPSLIADFVNLSKATGDSGDEIASLHDKLVNLSSIKGEDFLDLYDNMKYFQESTRATWDDMHGVIAQTSTTMLDFSEDARSAYAKSALAAGAAAKNMGLAATTPEALIENLLDNPQMMAKMQGLVGQGVDLPGLIAAGKRDEAFDEITKAIQRQFEGINLQDYAQRQYVSELTSGFGLDMNEIRLMRQGERMTGEGEGGTAAEMAAEAAVGAEGTIETVALAVRGTAAEEAEQLTGVLQSSLIEPGRKLAETVAVVVDVTEQALATAVGWQHFLDDATDGALSSIAAGLAAREVVMTGGKAVGKAVEAAGFETLGQEMQGKTILGKAGLEFGSAGAVVAAMSATKRERNQALTGGEEDFARFRPENVIPEEYQDIDLSPEEAQKKLKKMGKGLIINKIRGKEITPESVLESMDLEQFAPTDTSQFRGTIPEGTPIAPEQQQEMLEGAAPTALDTILGATPFAPLTQAGDTLQAGAVLFAETTRKHIAVVGMMASAFESFHSLFEDKKETTEKDTPAQVEVTDKQGEKRVVLQQDMLTELKTLNSNLKPGAGATAVKPTYTPGVDRSREFMELEKGYS